MSKNVDDDVAFIRALAEMLNQSELHEVEVKREYGEADSLEVRLSRSVPPAPAAAPAPAHYHAALPAHAPAASPLPAGDAAPPSKAEDDPAKTVTSPMVGTIYLAAEPGADNFVSVGDTVTEGQTLLIIEAMKTMNQIPAPRAGTVTKILVENAEPVEFGAPLMVIE